MTRQDEQELPSVFSMIAARKKLVFRITIAALAAGILYTIVATPVWEAKATIVFPVRPPSILGAGNFDQTSLAASLTGGTTPLKVYSGMLESEHALEMVSQGSGLSRRRIKAMRTLEDQSMESSITISARDANAELAKKVVALHIQALQAINEEVNKPLAANDSDVLKAKLDDQQKRVSDAEQRLLDFQNRAVTAPTVATVGSGKDTSVVPLGGRWGDMLNQLEIDLGKVQTGIDEVASRTHQIALGGGRLPSALDPALKWRDKLTDLQYDLQIQQLTLSPDAPEIVKLRKSIDITRGQLRAELEKYADAAKAGMVDPTVSKDGPKLPDLLTQKMMLDSQIRAVRKLAKLAPGEAIQLGRLVREVSTQSAILQQLQAQYAWAQLQTTRDPNHWEVMDRPEVDDKPVNKSFSKNGALSLIAGLALGCLAALYAPKRKSKPAAAAAPALEDRKAA